MAQVKGKTSIPMADLKRPQEPYAPGYSSSYKPQSYAPAPQASRSHTLEPQPPKSHAPDLYTPEPYTSDPYAPQPYTPDPYAPEPSAPESIIEFSDDCSYTVEIISGECPSPPPYSSIEVHCDQVRPVCCSGSQPPVVVAGIFSSKPASTICPCCRQIITTEVVFRVGSLTYAICTCLCLVGCFLGCCLIPFASRCCKDVDHYCPCCRYHIYRYKRL